MEKQGFWVRWVAWSTVCVLVLQGEVVQACPSSGESQISQLKTPQRISQLLDFAEVLARDSKKVEVLLGEDAVVFLKNRSRLKRILMKLDESFWWRVFEIAMGLPYGGTSVLFKYLFLKGDYEKAKNVILRIRELVGETKISESGILKAPLVAKYVSRYGDEYLVDSRVPKAWWMSGKMTYMLMMFLTAFVATHGIVVQAQLQHKDVQLMRDQIQDHDRFLSEVLSGSDPSTTLWVSPFVRPDQLQTASVEQLSNLYLEYKMVKAFFTGMHNLPIKQIPSKIKVVKTPEDICRVISDRSPEQKIATLVISTHGNAHAQLEFSGAGAVGPKELGQRLENSEWCGSKLSTRFASKVKVVFLACALANDEENRQNSELLAQQFARHVVVVEDLEVVMSRAYISVGNTLGMLADMEEVLSVTFPGQDVRSRLNQFEVEVREDVVSDGIKRMVLTPPVVKMMQQFWLVRDMKVHSQPDRPEVFHFQNGNLKKTQR